MTAQVPTNFTPVLIARERELVLSQGLVKPFDVKTMVWRP
jgi:hypothetical protein